MAGLGPCSCVRSIMPFKHFTVDDMNRPVPTRDYSDKNLTPNSKLFPLIPLDT